VAAALVTELEVVVAAAVDAASAALVVGAAVDETAESVALLEAEVVVLEAESVLVEVAVLEAASVLSRMVRLAAPLVVEAEVVTAAESDVEVLEAVALLELEEVVTTRSPPNPLTIDAMTSEASTPTGSEYTLVETTTNELAVAVPVALGPGVMVPDAELTGVSGSLMMSVGRCSDLVLVPLNEEETGELGNSMMSVILALEAEVVDEAEVVPVADSEADDDVADDASVEVASDEPDDAVGEASPSVGWESSEPSVGWESSEPSVG